VDDEKPISPLADGSLDTYERWIAFVERAAELARAEVQRRLAAARGTTASS
jgi:hypothetical protein